MKVLVKTAMEIERVRSIFSDKMEEMDFSILHVHDMRKVLGKDNTTLPGDCYIYHICNKELARAVFGAEMAMSLILPCRICIYEENGARWIGMISPLYMMEGITNDQAIKELVKSLEKEVTEMLERSF